MYRVKKFLLVISFLALYSIAIAQEEEYSKSRNRGNTDTEQTAPPQENTQNDNNQTDKKFDWKRVRIGGGFGLQFGNVTQINLSPQFGYYVIKDKLLVGAGVNFNYYNQRNTQYYYINGTNYYSAPFRSLFYGGNTYMQYNVWHGLNVYGQYVLINKDSYYYDRRVNVSHLLLGGGYNVQMGSAGQMNIMLLYDVINSDESVYQGTFNSSLPLILQVNFGFGMGNRR